MQAIPTDVLRDTFFIWMYVTITNLDDVKSGTLTSASILKDLEAGKHIKVGNSTNKATVEQSVAAVMATYSGLSSTRQALQSLTVLSPWAGGGKHPKVQELDAVYVAPLP